MTGSSYKEDGLTIPRPAKRDSPAARCVHAGGGVGMGHVLFIKKLYPHGIKNFTTSTGIEKQQAQHLIFIVLASKSCSSSNFVLEHDGQINSYRLAGRDFSF